MHTHIQESLLLGRAMAAQSHELKNVLAIIGEAAGLMTDLLDMHTSQGNALPEALANRLAKALGSIESQVARGHRLATDLNALAHLPDSRREGTRPGVDLGHIAMLAMRLTARAASQAKVELVAPKATETKIPADPQHCLTALLALLEWSLHGAPQDSRLEGRERSGEAVIELHGTPPLQTLPLDILTLTTSAGLALREENGSLCVHLKGGAR